jgi:hypothetical protein
VNLVIEFVLFVVNKNAEYQSVTKIYTHEKYDYIISLLIGQPNFFHINSVRLDKSGKKT